MPTAKVSKSAIDRAGNLLSKQTYGTVEELVHSEDMFDDFRKAHLEPLTQTTLELQRWLSEYGVRYYIAQRLKRKPQILRKLRRFSARLTQMQDVGGCRIIVEKNSDVDKLRNYLIQRAEGAAFAILENKSKDTREKGRDDSGYRALHLIIAREGVTLELQVRSKMQHYWAETIERTSVIYGHHLKELEGDPEVINYFRLLSDAFSEVEAGNEPGSRQKLELESARTDAEIVIRSSDRTHVFDSFVNEGIIKTLVEKEKSNRSVFNNWLLIFDWNQGSFVSWNVIDREAAKATEEYRKAEKQYTAEDGFEVVMIGSSDVATVRETHSHYFGIAPYQEILESLDESLIGFAQKMDLDIGARQILHCMHTRKVWGKKTILAATLKNHFCKSVLTFDSSLEALLAKGLVNENYADGSLFLNMKSKNQIETYLH